MKMNKILALAAACLVAACCTIAYAAGPQVSLGWTAPTLNTDGTTITGPMTYNLYQAPASGQPFVKIQTGITGPSAVVSSGVSPGTVPCFTVTAVVAAMESAQSAQVCATLPLSVPGSPSKLIIITIQ